jgi:hypothetical protein
MRLVKQAVELPVKLAFGIAVGAFRLVREVVAQDSEPVPAPPRAEPAAGNGGPPPAPPVTPEVRERVKEVDDEPTVVASTAEPGVEGGAGPEVHMDEPWDGYDSMTAQQVRRRLQDVESVELMAVRLYESSGKNRVSILRAIDSRLATP